VKRGAAAIAMALGLLVTSCSSNEPSPDEEAVCTTLQALVDQIVAVETDKILLTLDDLNTAVQATENDTLSAAGTQMFDAISVPFNGEDLTIAETTALGDQVLAESSAGMAGLIQACDEIGLPIENLPTSRVTIPAQPG
jgi:hypothetical protein